MAATHVGHWWLLGAVNTRCPSKAFLQLANSLAKWTVLGLGWKKVKILGNCFSGGVFNLWANSLIMWHMCLCFQASEWQSVMHCLHCIDSCTIQESLTIDVKQSKISIVANLTQKKRNVCKLDSRGNVWIGPENIKCVKIGPEKIKMCANITQKRENVCKLEKIKCVPETIWFEYGTPQQVVTACQESESLKCPKNIRWYISKGIHDDKRHDKDQKRNTPPHHFPENGWAVTF